ncbi:MAG: chemotaxis protein CheR [Sphingobacteriaceae bacterium]|jgi:two-component system CheB/CheR fusion protein|nr:chemotaxis protein CheR [Sphingobacteriaceae bacterium]
MAKISSSQYIIAIGASAGGLEAISAFFDYTPLDAVSYIIIQHLSADFKSHMATILDKHTKLQIVEATNNIQIEPNKVYLIPSSNFMAIQKGRLILSDKKGQKPPHMTIDYFFSSLAMERENKAIGVVLSGTGRDGSSGIQAIKNAGGIVLVQDPGSAAFNEMPIAAIGTGCADTILSPKDMPQVIEAYVKDGILEKPRVVDIQDITPAEVSTIVSLITDSLPLDFTNYKQPTIFRRIKRRMLQNNIKNAADYLSYLKSNSNEIQLLANDFLIGVTSFFRDAQAFKIMEKIVIPELVGHRGKELLKIWVAGCSSGEEAYSLAILISEHVEKAEGEFEVKIFATDINQAALRVAAKGVYTDGIEKDISKERLKNYFDKEGNLYKVKPNIRNMLIFAQHDLTKNPPYCNVDLICCRNLLIYLDSSLQKKVFNMMHFGLKKGGFLFLGPSENAAILKDDFDEINNKWKIFKSKKASRSYRFDGFPVQVIEGINEENVETGKETGEPLITAAVTDELNLAICEESGLSGVAADKSLKVIHSFGNLSRYLKNGHFKQNLGDLLPDEIAMSLKAAVHKALKTKKKVQLDGLFFKDKAVTRAVNITVKPLAAVDAEQSVMILFAEGLKPKIRTAPSDMHDLTKQYLLNLEKELTETRQNLEQAYQRIESTNENLQSFNEELLSANEELQSSNEELQSVNEELQTINREHHIANVALNELNDDLNNYFRSNVNGQLFVDRNLMLKNYSPGAVKHINIRESDIGRPLSNITTNMKMETLLADIEKVIFNDETIVREAESLDGKTYQVMTMPYIRTSTGNTDGAIISFYDITELKKLMKNLEATNNSLLRINGDLSNFVYGASHDLNAPIFNIEAVLKLLNGKIDMHNPEVLTLSGILEKSLVNVKAVITDLAKVGHIEADMLDDEHVESFEEKFRSIAGIISEKIRESKAVFKTDFQVKEVRFPKKNLRSIILNLITNAIKFRSPERYPEIFLKTEYRDGFILLTVKDNGIGITPDRMDYVFKMYQRLNIDIEGQGIGLYLVRKIINASGGKIEVESEIGKGSTFKVFFKA